MIIISDLQHVILLTLVRRQLAHDVVDLTFGVCLDILV